jgi:hypothetical protein
MKHDSWDKFDFKIVRCSQNGAVIVVDDKSEVNSIFRFLLLVTSQTQRATLFRAGELLGVFAASGTKTLTLNLLTVFHGIHIRLTSLLFAVWTNPARDDDFVTTSRHCLEFRV